MDEPIPDPDLPGVWFCPYCCRFDGNHRQVATHADTCPKRPDESAEIAGPDMT